jgi:hypothetical protein
MKHDIQITIASKAHLSYIPKIEQAILYASQQKATGIAVRSSEYLKEKMMQGKSIIACSDKGDTTSLSPTAD